MFERSEDISELGGVTTHTDAARQKQHDRVVDGRRSDGLGSSNMYGYQPGVIPLRSALVSCDHSRKVENLMSCNSQYS